jgi:hypothetical protein
MSTEAAPSDDSVVKKTKKITKSTAHVERIGCWIFRMVKKNCP